MSTEDRRNGRFRGLRHRLDLATSRLGRDRSKARVQQKLHTLEPVDRFTVEQASISRGELLELTITLPIGLEVVRHVASM